MQTQSSIVDKFKVNETIRIAAQIIERQSALRGHIVGSNDRFAAYASIEPCNGVVGLGHFATRREAIAAIVDAIRHF
jgi:ribosomal protein S5